MVQEATMVTNDNTTVLVLSFTPLNINDRGMYICLVNLNISSVVTFNVEEAYNILTVPCDQYDPTLPAILTVLVTQTHVNITFNIGSNFSNSNARYFITYKGDSEVHHSNIIQGGNESKQKLHHHISAI